MIQTTEKLSKKDEKRRSGHHHQSREHEVDLHQEHRRYHLSQLLANCFEMRPLFTLLFLFITQQHHRKHHNIIINRLKVKVKKEWTFLKGGGGVVFDDKRERERNIKNNKRSEILFWVK